jgi:hypothetical protein
MRTRPQDFVADIAGDWIPTGRPAVHPANEPALCQSYLPGYGISHSRNDFRPNARLCQYSIWLTSFY